MKKRIISILLAALMVCTLLSACAKTTPSSDTTSTSNTAADTSNTATDTSATTDAAADAATEENDPSKYKFVLVEAGVHQYYAPFQGAVEDAAADLGIPVPEIQAPQEWNQTEQNTILDSMLAKGATGVAMQPSDAVSGNEKITEIIDMGIPVVGFAGAPEQPSDMIFCLATDAEEAAYTGAKNLIEMLGGKGKIVHLTSDLNQGDTQKRIEGVERAVSEYPDIELVQTITDIDMAEPAMNAVNGLMASKRDEIDGIVATGYNQSVALATVFTQLQETRIKTVGYDADEAVVQAIRDGYMSGTMNQNPYGQAYLCVVGLKYLVDGYTYDNSDGMLVNSGFYLITKDNVDSYEETAAEATQALITEFTANFKAPEA